MARKMGAGYAMAVGVLMLVMWPVLFITGDIVELQTAPLEIYFHLAAELLTAVLLIAGGVGKFRGKAWGLKLYLLSMGMLIYTVMNSAGYYAQTGDIAFVTMFAVLFILTLFFTALTVRIKI